MIPVLQVTQRLIRFCLRGMFLVLLGACASGLKVGDIPPTPPPGVHVGNEIALLDSAPEKAVALMTSDGRVHLVVVTAAGDAVHLLVTEHGVERKEQVGTRHYGYYSNLAIADDAQGRLHLALKDEHWILENGVWRLAGENRCALLARAGASTACVVVVDGSELKTPAQWGVVGIGGGLGAGALIPYRIHPDKLVLGEAVGDGWSYRSILDHHARFSANLANIDSGTLAGDASGGLHLLFFVYEDNYYSARYHCSRLDQVGSPDIEWRPADGQRVMLRTLESVSTSPGAEWFVPADAIALAVDPQTGAALFFARHVQKGLFANWTDASVSIRDGVFGEPVPIPVKKSTPRRLAPAGNGRFHALVTVGSGLAYLAYRDGGWSEPVRIGEFGAPSLFLIANSSIQIASDGRNQALAVWPTREGGLVGRWIEVD